MEAVEDRFIIGSMIEKVKYYFISFVLVNHFNEKAKG